MSRVEPPELQRVVQDCIPRMIIAAGLPRSLARAVAERGCSSSVMHERFAFVHEEASRMALAHRAANEAIDAERAETLAAIASLLALRYQVRGHDSVADALLQQAVDLCVRWTMAEVSNRPAKSSRFQDGWASLRSRLSLGRRKPATMA